MMNWKIAIEIDIAKLLVVAGLALCVWLSTICGDGTVLALLIPAGIYGLVNKED